MSAPHQTSSLQNEAFLKGKVEELEREVSRLKRRLDELRKAKNTTVIKRERETLEVNAPNLGSRRESKSIEDDDLRKRLAASAKEHQKQLEALNKEYKSEIEDLKSKHSQELEKLRVSTPKEECGHAKEITDLKHALSDLQGDNAAILMENEDMKERITSLLHDLSVKEAKNCESEEDIEKKVSIKWQKMYEDWMAATEAKLAELQQANALLRRMIDTGRPRGRDPSGQDKGD